MDDHLSELNEKQKEAAVHMNGPLLIVAGAGAGKTKTITHRILNLIKNGVAPEKILAVTFTNKAAKEMRERIMSALGAENLLEWGCLAGRRAERQRSASTRRQRPHTRRILCSFHFYFSLPRGLYNKRKTLEF